MWSDCGVPSTQLTGVAAVTVRIRAYNATGNIIPEHRDVFTLGTRVLLTCDVTELPESSEVVSYSWYHSCTGGNQGRCQIRDRDPYYRVVNDVISQDQGDHFSRIADCMPFKGLLCTQSHQCKVFIILNRGHPNNSKVLLI